MYIDKDNIDLDLVYLIGKAECIVNDTLVRFDLLLHVQLGRHKILHTMNSDHFAQLSHYSSLRVCCPTITTIKGFKESLRMAAKRGYGVGEEDILIEGS